MTKQTRAALKKLCTEEIQQSEESECDGDVLDDNDDDVLDEVVGGVKTEISEPVMRYLEALFAKQEATLKKRFAENENTLLQKISDLEKVVEAKENSISELKEKVAALEASENVIPALKERVDVLEAKVNTIHALEKKVDEIGSNLHVVRAANSHLMLEIDDLQQYGRRMTVRIEGIEYSEKETDADLRNKIEVALASVNVDITPGMFVRYHRSGKPYVRDGKRVAQTIVRFSHWKPRLQAQKGKRIARENELDIMIRNDLTKRRHALLRKAISMLPKREDVFTFADSNSNLIIRDGEAYYHYNTEHELHDIISYQIAA